MMNLDGGEVQRLTNNGAEDWGPTWWPGTGWDPRTRGRQKGSQTAFAPSVQPRCRLKKPPCAALCDTRTRCATLDVKFPAVLGLDDPPTTS